MATTPSRMATCADFAHLPEGENIETLASQGSAWLRLGAWGGGDTAGIPPFEAVSIEVGALFLPID